jgi:hypothetical protein
MKLFSAAVLAAVLGALVSASTVQARPSSPHARIAGLTKEVRHLRKQLHDMTTLRNRANAALNAANSSLASANAQIATLNSLVITRTSERDAALNQVASLTAQIAAIPTPFAVAIEQVRREVAYARHNGANLPSSQGQLDSQASLDYVVGHVSASAYGYLEMNSLPLPGSAPDAILGGQAGICGHAALTFAAIVKRLGYPVRSVQFWYTDPPPYNTPDSHVADEVYYDDGWHFFDPTFGNFWTDTNGHVLSIGEVRAGQGAEQKDEASFTNLLENFAYGDSTAFETDPATTVEIDQQPFTG